MTKINWDDLIEVVYLDDELTEFVHKARYMGPISKGIMHVVAFDSEDNEGVINFSEDGSSGCVSQYKVRNIKQEPREFVCWVNVFNDGEETTHHTKADANELAEELRVKCIARKRIVVKEGEFDND